MGIGLNTEELGSYLDTLVSWKKAEEGRDVLILGGDLHFGVESNIMDKDGNVVLKQVITSAISNKPPPSLMSCLLRTFCMSSCCDATGGDYTFRHTSKKYTWNYTEIKISASNKEAAIDATIVYA